MTEHPPHNIDAVARAWIGNMGPDSGFTWADVEENYLVEWLTSKRCYKLTVYVQYDPPAAVPPREGDDRG